MKKGLIILMVIALLVACSSLMAASITWSVTASPANSGTFNVTTDPIVPNLNPAKFVAQLGTVINIQNITPVAGNYLDSVKMDGKVIEKTNLEFTADAKSHRIILYFKKNPVINASSIPKAGGTITPLGKVSVEYGGEQNFTVIASTGYEVKSVKVNGKDVQLTNNTYTISNVTAANTIAATFVAKSYTITSSVPGGHGKLTPSGATKVNHGTSPTYTAKPDKGFKAEIYVDGILQKQGEENKLLSYKYENVTSNSTIETKFILVTSPGMPKTVSTYYKFMQGTWTREDGSASWHLPTSFTISGWKFISSWTPNNYGIIDDFTGIMLHIITSTTDTLVATWNITIEDYNTLTISPGWDKQARYIRQ